MLICWKSSSEKGKDYVAFRLWNMNMLKGAQPKGHSRGNLLMVQTDATACSTGRQIRKTEASAFIMEEKKALLILLWIVFIKTRAAGHLKGILSLNSARKEM